MRGRFWRMSLLLAAVAVSMLLGGCSNGARRPGKVRVVATYSVLGDLIKNVAGDSAEVVTLVGPDGDAHTFEPTSKDGISLADADVIFENGVGFETWLDKLHSSSKSKAKRVVVTEGLQLREGECDHAHKPGEKHEHEDDPHVWHDVKNAVHMVGVIRERLAEADPPNADKYRANAAAYLDRLTALDAWVVEKVATLPEDGNPAGKASRFVATQENFGKEREFEGTVSAEIDGTPILGDFKEKAHAGHKH